MRSTIHSAATIALALVSSTLPACQPPAHPTQYASTIAREVCAFSFNCCTPTEREFFAAFGGDTINVDLCREDLEERLGGPFNVAAAAIDHGTATFDAEAADRCTSASIAAMQSCDSQTVLGRARGDSNTFVFLIDDDAECAALAQRGFTRGEVADGDDCTADVDCADFGSCDFGDTAAQTRAEKGVCVGRAGDGDSCSERNCQPGLSCLSDGEGGAVCTRLDVLADGDDCSGSGVTCGPDSSCVASGGTCSDESGPCADDFDCVDIAAACLGATLRCTADEGVDIEICDGL